MGSGRRAQQPQDTASNAEKYVYRDLRRPARSLFERLLRLSPHSCTVLLTMSMRSVPPVGLSLIQVETMSVEVELNFTFELGET